MTDYSTRLTGRKILIARSGPGSGRMAQALRDNGADVIEFPHYILTSPSGSANVINNIKEVLREWPSYRRLLFMSPESIHYFFQILEQLCVDYSTELFQEIKWYGAYEAVKLAIQEKGYRAELIHSIERAEEHKGDYRDDQRDDPKEDALLILGDNMILKRKEEFLTRWGDVQLLPLFEKEMCQVTNRETMQRLSEEEIDTLLFPNRASVRSFKDALDSLDIPFELAFSNVKVLCMGKQSAAVAREIGWQVHHVPSTPSITEVLDCLQRF
jgi:uroporphyrinogen III methyltransferase/synthase